MPPNKNIIQLLLNDHTDDRFYKTVKIVNLLLDIIIIIVCLNFVNKIYVLYVDTQYNNILWFSSCCSTRN